MGLSPKSRNIIFEITEKIISELNIAYYAMLLTLHTMFSVVCTVVLVDVELEARRDVEHGLTEVHVTTWLNGSRYARSEHGRHTSRLVALVNGPMTRSCHRRPPGMACARRTTAISNRVSSPTSRDFASFGNPSWTAS